MGHSTALLLIDPLPDTPIYLPAYAQGRGRVLDVLAEIQERNRAVKDLEQSMLELHQIFLDMAVLVEAQGEMLDNIQKQVERSVNYVKVR